MLDFLILSADSFEHQHGVKPNILYLNEQQLEYVLQQNSGQWEVAEFFPGSK